MLWVELTDAGRQVTSRFRPLVHQHQKMWLEVLNEHEKEQLVEILHRLEGFFMEAGD
jgi:DNA-binding MarR family transcriptional regulator